MGPWNRGSRKVVIHYHVFKNAGTSIDRLLVELLGSSWFEFDTGIQPLRPDFAARLLNDRPQVEALSSHLLRPPAPEGFSVFPIALVRHPLDRAYSCYSYSRRTEPIFESLLVAHRSSFPEYVTWCLDHPVRGGMVIVNYQTIHFSSASFRGDDVLEAVASESDLEEAWALISSLPVPGVVDGWETYIERLRPRLSEFVGRRIEAAPVRANVSAERPLLPLPQAVSELGSLLGPGLLNRFREANEFDYRLHERTAKLAAGGTDEPNPGLPWPVTARNTR